MYIVNTCNKKYILLILILVITVEPELTGQNSAGTIPSSCVQVNPLKTAITANSFC